jgi:hypothetical protein
LVDEATIAGEDDAAGMVLLAVEEEAARRLR